MESGQVFYRLFSCIGLNNIVFDEYAAQITKGINISESDIDIIQTKLSQLDWGLLSDDRALFLSNMILNISSVYPIYSVGLIKSLFVSFVLDVKSIVPLLSFCLKKSKDSSCINSHRTQLIKKLMEDSSVIEENFNDVLTSYNWNRFLDTDTLLTYIINFLCISELDFKLPKNKIIGYKHKIHSLIFEIMVSLDCDMNEKMLKSKFRFMKLLRKKNMALGKVLSHKKLSEFEVEQLECYDKLDILLKFTFDYFDSLINGEYSDDFTHLFIKLFDRIVIRTHKTRCVQYFWFYHASKNEMLRKKFLNYMWKNIFKDEGSSVIRNNYISYFGSFLASCNQIDYSCIKFYVSKLVSLLKTEESNISDSCVNYSTDYAHFKTNNIHTIEYKNFKKNETFYHLIFITLMVIVRTLNYYDKTKSQFADHFSKFVQSLNFVTFINSSLKPLRYCDSNVVENLIQLNKKYDFVPNCICTSHYSKSKLKTNFTQNLSVFFKFRELESGTVILDYSYPFGIPRLPLTIEYFEQFLQTI